MDPHKQYYTLLNNNKNGEKQYSTMPYLSDQAFTLGDNQVGVEVTRDYVNNYLMKLSNAALYNQDNMQFIAGAFLNGSLKSNDKAFNILYNHENQVDSLIKAPPHLAEGIIKYVIERDDVEPLLWEREGKKYKVVTNNPDWNTVDSLLSSKYRKFYVDFVMVDMKVNWYRFNQNWQDYLKELMLLMANYKSSIDTYNIERYAWSVFQHSLDRNQLATANSWISDIVHNQPDEAVTDTYANIFYKLGDNKEAINWETKALELAKARNIQVKVIGDTLEKMKKGEPTWPLK
jgi:hypothetical protein